MLASEVKEGVRYEIAEHYKKEAQRIYAHCQVLEARNKELENPKGSHYELLSWRGKITFCIRKMKRPLRSREIIQELQIMDTKDERLKCKSNSFVSVVLAQAVEAELLHIEKVSGTRGAYYALPEWLNEEGKLPEKMLRRM